MKHLILRFAFPEVVRTGPTAAVHAVPAGRGSRDVGQPRSAAEE
jgi:hypothetical protein